MHLVSNKFHHFEGSTRDIMGHFQHNLIDSHSEETVDSMQNLLMRTNVKYGEIPSIALAPVVRAVMHTLLKWCPIARCCFSLFRLCRMLEMKSRSGRRSFSGAVQLFWSRYRPGRIVLWRAFINRSHKTNALSLHCFECRFHLAFL